MDRATLETLKRLEEAGTPPPWEYKAGVFKHYVGIADYALSRQEMHPEDGRDTNAENDMPLIAAMRNALPGLLQRLSDLETMHEGSKILIDTQKRELTTLRAAADELLLLKDDLKQSDPEEYERRKEGAWDALRKARGG